MYNFSDRYHKQMILNGFGHKVQERLLSANIAIVGLGGLGSVVSTYLTLAGLGHLKLFDFDVVEISNLNRQLLYTEDDIGRPKVDVALEKLNRLNPDVTTTGIKTVISTTNVINLLEGVDGVVDCLDNFKTRYIINEAIVKLGIPLFHAACFGFEGRVTTILPGKTACLRCIYPGTIMDSNPTPIVGATCGVIGSLQAMEVIKYIAKIGELLAGKLLLFDGESSVYKLIDVERNDHCPVCGNIH